MKTRIALSALCLAPALSMAGEGDIQWNGYLNVVGGILKEEPYDRVTQTGGTRPGRQGYTDEWSVDRNTSAALQASRRLDDQSAITAQVYSSGAEDNYAAQLKWLYYTWDASPQSRWRIGRIGRPVYYYSDFLDVGYAYHWVTPPQEVYSLDTTMTGVDYAYNGQVGAFEWSTEFMAGTENQYLSEINADTQSRNIHGGVLTLTRGGWLTLRAAWLAQAFSVQQDLLDSEILVDLAFDDAVSRGLIDQATANALQPAFTPTMIPLIDEAVVIEDEDLIYREAAIRIDQPDWFVMLEAQEIRSGSYLYSHSQASYLTGGRRLGDWLLHATYAIYEQDVCDLCAQDYAIAQTPIAQIPPAQLAEAFGRSVRSALSVSQVVKEETFILGANIDTSDNSVLKFELTRYDWRSPYPTKVNEVGVNWMLRTALNVTF